MDPVASHETALVGMNKLFAILFLLGALGSFGLSQRASLKAQETGTRGTAHGARDKGGQDLLCRFWRSLHGWLCVLRSKNSQGRLIIMLEDEPLRHPEAG